MNLLDFILDLFRSPASAASYIQDPDGALRSVGLQNVSAAQFQAVAASAAPAGVLLGGGNPVQGLQHAVASYHNIPAAFSPQTAFAPQTDFASHNATELASNNDTSLLSPDQHAGSNAQQGAFNLGFGDITLGDKTSNSATNGGVVNTGTAGDIDTTSVNGDGNVVGEGNSANTGYIEGGSHSPILIGEGNDTKVTDTSQHSGGDIITGNEGTVIKDNDMSGGNGGSAGSSGGGSLLGIGTGGNEANAGGGGGGGSIIVNDTSSHSTTSSVGGNQTSVGGDLGSGNHTDNSVNTNLSTETETHTDNHVDTTVDDHSFTSNVASGNSTDIASHNDTDLASHNDTNLDAF
ncbi:hypothetical protein TUM20983_50070 [Mycobacterium antarcticum]|uniref:IniB N-terminal domain-containing protein n=1 Tax=Mycolicibacterium sp. TUM20983 TaxID=3023369 RepID=UPI002393EA8F|nr:IniB N-terminal domain-containing protein [Mycolicibacterium sp. TUM20983]GLP77897.1 hypothetical protein TUM20983_50070 [Mycolicibacterium sp. TUM20983]